MLLLMAAVTLSQTTPRSEHPRPDMMRAQWLNLNGSWEFAETNDPKLSFLDAKAYPDKIIVPFCRESALSGLGRKGFVTNVWYRREFQVPNSWDGKRIRLHIGACDWLTTVWVNGKQVGEHQGGSAAFAFDVTDFLISSTNSVVIKAFDDTKSGLQAAGKQSQREESHGIFYTRTTGIWQTVWLEGVGRSYIENLRIEPDLANKCFNLRAEVRGETDGITVKATLTDATRKVSEGSVIADWRNGQIRLNVENPKLWSTKNPYLYDLKVELVRDGQTIDEIKSYCGMRSVTIKGYKLLINGEPVFQRLVLDQGFYPDGIWTASSDKELKADIERSMAYGFNGARLHQKVFEPRFLYWADKLGYLCWGESPNYGLNHEDPRVDLPVLEEWGEIVRRDRNHPAIIGWCPFNETPDSAARLQQATVNLTRQLDPSRPVIETSGWSHHLADPEVIDAHDYDQNPMSFRQRWNAGSSPLPDRYSTNFKFEIPFMVSEFGGIGWDTGKGWGYGAAPKTLDEFYVRFEGLARALMDNPHMFGFCYTQLTDVEQERNGMYTYDRKPKFDVAKIHAMLSAPAAFETGALPKPRGRESWTVIVGSARDEGTNWRYTEINPPANWTAATFSDRDWKSGPGGFGAKGGFEKDVRTPWMSPDIWLRQNFSYDGAKFSEAWMPIHFDNATEVYLNGQLIWKSEDKTWNDGYAATDVTAAVKKALTVGQNLIAVHTHQDTGGQFIDLALLLKG